MNDREKAIVMAYTGAVMLAGDKLEIFYQYVQEKLGRCVMTHELAFPEVQDAIKDAVRDDFIELAKDNNAPGKNGWISVKDRLPEKNTPILWYVVLKDRGMGHCRLGTFEGTVNHEIPEVSCCGPNAIPKFWMQLPEPPKEE